MTTMSVEANSRGLMPCVLASFLTALRAALSAVVRMVLNVLGLLCNLLSKSGSAWSVSTAVREASCAPISLCVADPAPSATAAIKMSFSCIDQKEASWQGVPNFSWLLPQTEVAETFHRLLRAGMTICVFSTPIKRFPNLRAEGRLVLQLWNVTPVAYWQTTTRTFHQS